METIPIVDISPISLKEVEVRNRKFEEVGRLLSSVFRDPGFVYLKNHGIQENLITECMARSKDFFDLPEETKLKYSRGIHETQGYSQKGREVLESSETVEAKESFDINDLDFDLPECPGLRKSIRSLAHQSAILARRLLRCLANDLKVNEKQFLEDHSHMFSNIPDKNGTALRILHYPPVEEEAVGGTVEGNKKLTRCGAHTDYGGMTLLYQDDVGGLEVQNKDKNEWIRAEPVPGTIVVNIGDLLEVWSGGRYRATSHRVRIYPSNSRKSRFSIAVFIHPNHETIIKPINKPIGEEEEPKTARDHLQMRFSQSYYK